MSKFAIIETGSKQYLVKDGDVIYVDPIRKPTASNGAGTKVVFDRVLLTDDGKETKVGAPHVSGAKVAGEILEEGREKKVTVIRYRQKSRYFKKKGHRQPYTKVKIISL
ncbi:50S ribosomal protein L21 [Candidatus Kaiserbacteria bacterium RIFCSPLOWO2_01_FULL_53_17]|uniref:Large ribosomal subunit protein bL21 n=1 Tax=Candidatus Kaiserbacteria bacterium RIFCSPLOWO2_01_FULL_53_17 TaxID=1798511 RepID=A0A1F6EGJ5_9BACT|nr:MAG: 50S ribosomal protein L21 [Candidatus Kaiserbacteria bacterium RIFCSPLOWO2_01_FULL_53_17]